MEKTTTKRIKVTDKCNQDCIFCDSNASPDPNLYSRKRIKSQIAERGNLERLNITGGEPTICNDLVKYIQLAKKTGYRDIAVLTNGNRFADEKYASIAKKSGLTEAIVSIYHYDPKISENISRTKKTFQKKIDGITNLKNLGIKITANIVIFSGNYTAIPKLVSYLHSTVGVKRFAFSYLEPNCTRVAANPRLIPPLKKSMAHLKRAMDYCKRNKLRYLIPYNGAVPSCIFKVYKLDVIKPEKIVGSDFDYSRSYYPVCYSCKEKDYCLGILKEYASECLNILKRAKTNGRNA